jgi:hypothetical protein
MHWHTSLSVLSLAAGAIAKHYAIMDNDWYTAGFVPYLIALDGDIDVLALASGKHLPPWTLVKYTNQFTQTLPTVGSHR